MEKTLKTFGQPAIREHHLSRNDKCFCGSGKKVKHCCNFKVENSFTIKKKPVLKTNVRFECRYCKRLLTKAIPHKCTTGFRKHKLKFKTIEASI